MAVSDRARLVAAGGVLLVSFVVFAFALAALIGAAVAVGGCTVWAGGATLFGAAPRRR